MHSGIEGTAAETAAFDPAHQIKDTGMTSAGTHEANFERVKAQLKARLGNDVYSSWFGRMKLAEASRGLIRLSVPTAFLRQWINSHYRDLITELWKQGDPAALKVEVVVRSAARSTTPVVEEERASVRKPQRPSSAAGRLSARRHSARTPVHATPASKASISQDARRQYPPELPRRTPRNCTAAAGRAQR